MSSADRPCPACGRSGARPLFEKAGYRVLECSCGTAFTARLPSPEELNAHYGLDYFQGNPEKFGYVDYSAEEPFLLQSFRAKVERLRRSPGPGRVLDVGCATGGFLKLLGPEWRRCGIELSRELLDSQPATPGVSVWNGDFLSYPPENGPFDVLTMWDALDHIPDPAAALRKAHALLRPGGTLAMNLGDRRSLFARVMGRRWHLYIPPTHLTYFTRESLTALLERAGFRVVQCEYEGKWVPLSLCFFRLSYILTHPFFRWLSDRFSEWRIGQLKAYVNLRDVMTIYAVKIDPAGSSRSADPVG